MELATVMRVQFALSVLSRRASAALFAGLIGMAFLQGCATGQPPALAQAPRPMKPAKIVRFADALGAVATTAEASKLQSMLAAFDYCDREQRLAFVTPPMAYSSHINYSRVSTYSLRFSSEADSNAVAPSSYVAPFECIDQKHSVKTGLLESEDVPSNALRGSMHDHRGGVIVHRSDILSAFRENDIVVEVGSFRVESRGELVKAVDVSPVGNVSFGVVRSGKLIQLAGLISDTTDSTQKNALKLLEALCKETGASSRSCATHAFKD
jgi:hypothetical protein